MGVLDNPYVSTRTIFWRRRLVEKKTLRVRGCSKTSCHSRFSRGVDHESAFRPLYVATIFGDFRTRNYGAEVCDKSTKSLFRYSLKVGAYLKALPKIYAI